MKIRDIKTDGTVYYFSWSSDWGPRLVCTSYEGPFVRVDGQRYIRSHGIQRDCVESDRGNLVAARTVGILPDGTLGPIDPEGQIWYIPAVQVRGSFDEVKALSEQKLADQAELERKRKIKAENARAKADTLAERLVRLGVDRIIVSSTQGHGGEPPEVVVDLATPYATLSDLLDRIERVEAEVHRG